jgi:hypothetical protein
MRKPHRCYPRQLTAVVIILALLLVVGIGAWSTWRGGDDDLTTRELSRRPSKFDPVAQPDGSWCAKEIATACVRPDGAIHIPKGNAPDTLIAYFAIRTKMRDVDSPPSWGWALGEAEYQTQEVSGQWSASDALARMLEGSGLTVDVDRSDRVFIQPRERSDANSPESHVGGRSGS